MFAKPHLDVRIRTDEGNKSDLRLVTGGNKRERAMQQGTWREIKEEGEEKRARLKRRIKAKNEIRKE